MRRIEPTNTFKRDYKRESKGKYRVVQKMQKMGSDTIAKNGVRHDYFGMTTAVPRFFAKLLA